jgi:hypothetical protein
MKSRASSQAKSFDGGEAVRSGLPILGTAVFVWILSGGFPPTTWVFLFQTITQLNRLFATQGTAAILPLTILIVQSLFLAAAWGLLGWVILREGAYLVTMQSKAELDRLLAFQASTDKLRNPSQVFQLSKQSFDMTTDQLENERVLGPTTEHLEEEQDFDVIGHLEKAQNFGVTTGPLRREKDFAAMTTPLREKQLEKEVARASRTRQLSTVQSSSIGAQNIQPTSVQPRNAQPASVEARNVQPRNAQPASVEARNVPSRNVQPRNVQPASVEARNVQPRNAQSRSVQSRNVQPASMQSRRTSHLRQGLSTRNLQKEDLLDNPFDKEVSPTSFNGRQGRIEKVMQKEIIEETEEEVNEEDDNPFVFGNPFDGPLPEVFRYDADLRRSVPELAEEGKTVNSGSKAKGK